MNEQVLIGDLLGEEDELSLDELCQACSLEAGRIVELVDEGILRPDGRDRTTWRFTYLSIEVVGKTRRLQQDLGVNLPGAALALELLEEIERLRSHLEVLDRA